MGRHIANHHRTGANIAMVLDMNALTDGGVGAQPDTIAQHDRAGDLRTCGDRTELTGPRRVCKLNQVIEQCVAPERGEVSEQSFVHAIAGTHMNASREPNPSSVRYDSALVPPGWLETIPANDGVRLNHDPGADISVRQDDYARPYFGVIGYVHIFGNRC